MAKKSLISKCEKAQRRRTIRHKVGARPLKATKVYNRCKLCGRPRGYMRDFGICRICFRNLANKGMIVGVRKSSW